LGNSTSLTEEKKTIYNNGLPWFDGHFCNLPALRKRWKFDRSGRRYKLRAHMYDNCSYTADDLNSTNGWNKIGRITFEHDGSVNTFKMHLGWIFRDDPNTISFALFYHNNTAEEKAYVVHKIDERYFTDANSTIDMYLGQRVIGMIINNEQDYDYDIKCIGIRQDNSGVSVAKNSFVSKTFYFGGNSKAPHTMETKFHDQRVDDGGYQTKFNDCDIMTWNITEFISSDKYSYTANKTINGSVAEKSTVAYGPNHPNKVYRKCIIPSGADISFAAGEKVHLYHGFHAKPGSRFEATIHQPTKININNIPKVFDNQISYGVENVKSVELGFYTDETLDNLVYGKQFYVNPRSSICKTTIDTILPLKKYYVVANLYSGKGSQKRIKGWVTNLNYGFKQSVTDVNGTVVSTNFRVYPNPSNGIFTVKLNNYELVNSIQIINTKAQIVYKNNKPNKASITIDISNQVNGMYILSVQTNEGIETYKLVKN